MEPFFTNLNATRAIYDAKACIDGGFTSVRELGGIGLKLRDTITDGTAQGPHLYSTGSALGITSGHADSHNYPLDFVTKRACETWFSLGPRAPKSGELKAGYNADLLLLNSDPFSDIASIQDKNSIKGVFIS